MGRNSTTELSTFVHENDRDCLDGETISKSQSGVVWLQDPRGPVSPSIVNIEILVSYCGSQPSISRFSDVGIKHSLSWAVTRENTFDNRQLRKTNRLVQPIATTYRYRNEMEEMYRDKEAK